MPFNPNNDELSSDDIKAIHSPKVDTLVSVGVKSKDQKTSVKRVYVSPGMPELDMDGKAVSFFEFWPMWLMYFPIVIQWLFLSIIHRSITLPLIANPKLLLSGMVGVPKSDILSQATGQCAAAILPWFLYTVDESDIALQSSKALALIEEKSFGFPVVCKPDIGCRGSGVQLIHNCEQLEQYIGAYPKSAQIMIQKLSNYEPEAGVFFVREPNQKEGKIISLALKYTPYVVGDGISNLRQLIARDPRASQLQHLYLSRHKDRLDEVIKEGKPYKLVFSASHCRGAIFANAHRSITVQLTKKLNNLLSDLPEFYYGRLDIKFSSLEKLEEGKDIEIIEINTASSESLHIWDKNTSFSEAIKSLLFQYRTLFKLGHQNRLRGFKPPGALKLWKHWQLEKKLTAHYPSTD